MASNIKSDVDVSTAMASPGTVTLAGKKYRLTPLKQREWGEFERWLKDSYLELAKRNVRGMEGEDRDLLLKHAFDRAALITFQSSEAINAMETFDGAVKLVWLSLRAEHPDLTEENVATLLLDPKTLEQVMERLPLGVEEPKKNPTRKTQRKRRKVERHRRKTSG